MTTMIHSRLRGVGRGIVRAALPFAVAALAAGLVGCREEYCHQRRLF